MASVCSRGRVQEASVSGGTRPTPCALGAGGGAFISRRAAAAPVATLLLGSASVRSDLVILLLFSLSSFLVTSRNEYVMTRRTRRFNSKLPFEGCACTNCCYSCVVFQAEISLLEVLLGVGTFIARQVSFQSNELMLSNIIVETSSR